jgi:Zn-dependent protease with chaperone function
MSFPESDSGSILHDGMADVNTGTRAGYRANAFAPEDSIDKGPAKTGTLSIESSAAVFRSGDSAIALPLAGLQMRRGGHNDEQIFLEHPGFPGWSIYSSDLALLRDPVLSYDPRFAHHIMAAERARNARPLARIIGLGLIALVLMPLLLLWFARNRIIEAIARKVPGQWEQSFGDQAFEQIRREGKIVTDSGWDAHLEKITARLLPVVSQNGYSFQFHILRDTNVNAFALPGGHIVILTGLLEASDSAEEVAGVLAHEMAHVTRRHSLRNVIQSAGLVILAQTFLGDASGLVTVAGEGSRFLLKQKFSRDFEREADDTGWNYLVEANIDPRGMTRFFARIKAMIDQSDSAAFEHSLALLNTHPTSQERIDRLEIKWETSPRRSGFDSLGPWPKKPETKGP